MHNNWLTDEAVEAEIARLQESDFVKLARKEMRLKYKRRQILYNLRNLDKRGKELAKAGITPENIEAMIAMAEAEEI
jgi:SOS response regulatory protein OraA/RecX